MRISVPEPMSLRRVTSITANTSLSLSPPDDDEDDDDDDDDEEEECFFSFSVQKSLQSSRMLCVRPEFRRTFISSLSAALSVQYSTGLEVLYFTGAVGDMVVGRRSSAEKRGDKRART
jgi:hypothetical protein